MAVKHVDIVGIGQVSLYKRHGTRSIRLSLVAGGVRVTMPSWVPYKTALGFVEARRTWIAKHRPLPPSLLSDGAMVGKSHRLSFISQDNLAKPRAIIRGNEICIYYPSQSTADHPAAQAAAEKACLRALRRQAEDLLPVRLAELAQTHGFHYKNATIKRLKSRWGSCNERGDISLSLYLMQLPWALIDHVLLHELIHTEILRHGPPFWSRFEEQLPDFKNQKNLLNTYQPKLTVWSEGETDNLLM